MEIRKYKDNWFFAPLRDCRVLKTFIRRSGPCTDIGSLIELVNGESSDR